MRLCITVQSEMITQIISEKQREMGEVVFAKV